MLHWEPPQGAEAVFRGGGMVVARRSPEPRDLPVHYQDRIYGVTKMKRVFAKGVRMLRMCWVAGVKPKGEY